MSAPPWTITVQCRNCGVLNVSVSVRRCCNLTTCSVAVRWWMLPAAQFHDRFTASCCSCLLVADCTLLGSCTGQQNFKWCHLLKYTHISLLFWTVFFSDCCPVRLGRHSFTALMMYFILSNCSHRRWARKEEKCEKKKKLGKICWLVFRT